MLLKIGWVASLFAKMEDLHIRAYTPPPSLLPSAHIHTERPLWPEPVDLLFFQTLPISPTQQSTTGTRDPKNPHSLELQGTGAHLSPDTNTQAGKPGNSQGTTAGTRRCPSLALSPHAQAQAIDHFCQCPRADVCFQFHCQLDRGKRWARNISREDTHTLAGACKLPWKHYICLEVCRGDRYFKEKHSALHRLWERFEANQTNYKHNYCS